MKYLHKNNRLIVYLSGDDGHWMDIIAFQDYERFMARIGYLLNDDKTEDLENEGTDTLRCDSLR